MKVLGLDVAWIFSHEERKHIYRKSGLLLQVLPVSLRPLGQQHQTPQHRAVGVVPEQKGRWQSHLLEELIKELKRNYDFILTFHNGERSTKRSLRMTGMINSFSVSSLLAWKKAKSFICGFGKYIKLFKYNIDGYKILKNLKKLCLGLKKELLCNKVV